jgi:hypothetical protein
MRDAYPLTKTASDGLADLENLIWNPALPNVNPPAPGDGGGAAP